MNDEEFFLLENVVLEPKFKIEPNLKKFDLKQFIEESSSECLHLIAVCLNRFAQLNFVGPKKFSYEWTASIEETAENLLEMDGELPYFNADGLEYLIFAKWLAVDFGELLREKFPSVDVWAIRAVFLWQKLLPDKSASLKKICLENMKRVEKFLSTEGNKKNLDLISLLYAELSTVYLFYYEYKCAEKSLASSLDLSQLNVHLSGALGRKTRFQQKDVAQLVLQIASDKIRPTNDESAAKHLPIDCRLNDDTLLDKIDFTDLTIDSSENLTPGDQCVLLSVHNLAVRGKASDVLNDEESSAYLDKLLAKPQLWVVQSSALLARCRLEMNRRRKVERCLSQLEELVQQFNDASQSDASQRLKYFFFCDTSPVWMVEKFLADVLVRLGASRSALEIYLRLKMWTETVACYKQLDMLDRAESLIRDRLAKEETPLMLCLLGDITMHEDYYLRAWTVSKGRCAEAKKRLGFLYFNRKMYEKATDAFQEAAKIQPLQKDTWFTLGHCAVQIDRHDIAIEAYRRCVNIDADDFESWNNLAASYVQLDRKEQAFLILLEALKCNYENWKLWDNVVLLGADIGRFNDSIKGLHRLLDLKEKYYDANVLSVLVDATTVSSPAVYDYAGEPAAKFKNELKKFFGRLTAAVPTDPRLWRLYADLSQPDSLDELEYEKYLNFLKKAYACAVQKNSWEKVPEECLRVLIYLEKMAEACLKYANFLSDDDAKKAQAKGSVRLALKSVVGLVQKFYGVSDDEKLKNEILSDHFEKLQKYLINFD